MDDIKSRIKFDNKVWIVFDSFVFEGKKYLYIGSEDTAKGIEEAGSIEKYNGKIEIEFIYELPNKNFKNVTDEAQINRLLAFVAENKLKNRRD